MPTIVKTGITLAVIAAICTALVALIWQVTRERIAANQQAFLEQSLTPALSGVFYDGSISESMMIPAFIRWRCACSGCDSRQTPSLSRTTRLNLS